MLSKTLAGIGICLGLASSGLAADTDSSSVRAEAHRILLADLRPAPAAVPKTAPAPLPASVVAPADAAAAPKLATAPAENPVQKFLRTGVLVGDRPENPLNKVSVGACEGGQLLNLRSIW